MKTKILAVMFTDIVGYTQKTSSQTYAENAELLRQHSRIVHPLMRQFSGKVVKEIGDAVLATFASPTHAVEAAMAIQDRLALINRDREPETQLHLRIAINVGEVRIERGDVFGEGVNVAARIEAETPVDEIYVSGSTYLTMNRSGIPLKFLGQRTLKGISEPVTLFALPRFTLLEDESLIQTKHHASQPYGGRQLAYLAHRRRRRIFATGVIAAALLAIAGTGAYHTHTRMQLQKHRVAVDAAIASHAWRRAAEQLAILRSMGVDISPQSDTALMGVAATGRSGQACRALDLFDNLFVLEPARRDMVARLRMQHAFGLLKLGELAQAGACLEAVAFAATSPDGRQLELNRIHLDAMQALHGRSASSLRDALKRYETFLRGGNASPEHLDFMAEIVAEAYLIPKARPIADSLVVEFLGVRATHPLAERIVTSSTPGMARSWMVARLESVAHDVALDWANIYSSQLEDRSCAARRLAIERLRRLGRLSVAGLLLREAEKGDRCTRTVARAAVADLVANGDRELFGASPTNSVLVASR